LENILNSFPLYTLIFTDGSASSVCPQFAGYAFHNPKLHISCFNYLPPTASSFTAECCAIVEALQLISILASNKLLIASDSLSYF